jgi:gluconolactonase
MTKLPLSPPETRNQVMDFFPQPIAPTVPCSEMSIFAEGLDHPEGLAFDADGALWAGGEAGQIYRISEGRTELVGNLGGFCLGLTVSRQQDLFVCNIGLHAVQRLDRTGRVLETFDKVDGQKLETPNFSVFDSEGNLYFSDSGQWNKSNGCVFRLRASGVAEMFAGPFAFANGLCLNKAEDALFVVESQRDCVTRVPILRDGTAGPLDIYARGLARVPDGVAIDEEQNLYVTCYATDCLYRITPGRAVELFAYDPEGTILARPTNAAFGGPKGKDLYVANLGRWHITRLQTETTGQPLAGERRS